MDYGPSLIGLLVGLVVGATSTGGGALLTPALVLIARVPVATAIGSDVLIASGMKLFGGGIYALRGEVHWQTVGRLASGSVAGAVAGIWLLNRIPAAAIDAWLAPALGIVLIAAGGAIILRLTAGPDSRPRHAPRRHVTVLVGLATGLLVSMTSIGSGSILLCVLALYYPLSATTIVGTDLVHALVVSSVATVGHSLAGRVDVALAAAVLVGAVPGVMVGARIATAIPERMLRAGLAAVLIAIGLQMAIFATPPAHAETAAPAAQEGNRSWTTSP